MAKTTIRDSFNIQAQMQASLKEAGIENRAALDKLMSKTTIEVILRDAPAVYNYFKLANIGLWAMLEPKDLRAVRGEPQSPQEYREYFDNQNPQPTPYFNVIPYQDIFNPQALGEKAGFKPEQTEAYAQILQGSGNGGEQGATWSDVEGQGAQGGGYGGGGYGGGTGKAMSTGGSYGSGKAMSTGGSPQSKSLGAPPPPPGMGGPGGGYVPPPPMPGAGGPGYGDPGFNYDPTAGTQQGRAYVEQNLYNDPSYGWFQQLFGRQDFVTGIYMAGASELDKIRRARAEITEALANADPKQVMLLNAKMQDISSREREITDKMMRAQHYQNEFVNLVKGMIDIQMRTTDAIVRNMRQ